MKRSLLSLLKFWFLFVFALASRLSDAQELAFTYDAAGNQTSRKWVCVNCTTSKDVAEAAKIEETTEEPELLQQASEEEEPELSRPLTVYPNPVSETLYVEWEGNFPVKEVFIYGNSGNLVGKKGVATSQTQAELQFATLPVGVYVMIVIYQDGHKEAKKIIKK